ncbi:MAG: hypothetical protein GTN35_05150 [Nitrososphaeria archaeon]|nr:hypothetical protein [Nitrososphaeria archaeon]NIS95657.1 hypothetical protein [Nitrosopumilaceae archaeon]
MMFWFLSILSTLFLAEIEIGVIAFVVTLIIIIVAVIVKIIKNKQLEKNGTDR